MRSKGVSSLLVECTYTSFMVVSNTLNPFHVGGVYK